MTNERMLRNVPIDYTNKRETTKLTVDIDRVVRHLKNSKPDIPIFIRNRIKNKETPPQLCYLLRREATNSLGIRDSFYYFLLYRGYADKFWARRLDKRTEDKNPGVAISMDFLRIMAIWRERMVSSVLIATIDKEKKLSLGYLMIPDMFKWIDRHRTVYTEKGKTSGYLPLRVLDPIDPFDIMDTYQRKSNDDEIRIAPHI